MKSLRTFKDEFGIVRKNGEEWLITMKDNETHIPGVYEEVRYTTALCLGSYKLICTCM